MQFGARGAAFCRSVVGQQNKKIRQQRAGGFFIDQARRTDEKKPGIPGFLPGWVRRSSGAAHGDVLESLPILVRTKRSQPGLKTKGRRNTIIEPALNGGLSAKNPQM